MAQLTEWLKLMVAEVNRKREEAERAQTEEATRNKELSNPRDTQQPQPERRSA
jgi:hypothetical protein